MSDKLDQLMAHLFDAPEPKPAHGPAYPPPAFQPVTGPTAYKPGNILLYCAHANVCKDTDVNNNKRLAAFMHNNGITVGSTVCKASIVPIYKPETLEKYGEDGFFTSDAAQYWDAFIANEVRIRTARKAFGTTDYISGRKVFWSYMTDPKSGELRPVPYYVMTGDGKSQSETTLKERIIQDVRGYDHIIEHWWLHDIAFEPAAFLRFIAMFDFRAPFGDREALRAYVAENRQHLAMYSLNITENLPPNLAAVDEKEREKLLTNGAGQLATGKKAVLTQREAWNEITDLVELVADSTREDAID